MTEARTAPPVIRLLAPAVADTIAAGEVVERPASVVKELCENALDAGAMRVSVEVEGGGTVRIRVVDDGCGIPADQLPLAVARHATSKIGVASDLAHVVTLGFRGEALASMAAVADVVVVSRPASATSASRLRVRAAEVLEHAVAAGSPGTTVEVRDLFATTPARLRFLRSARTETAACVRVVGDLAVAHPGVAFHCTVDGRAALRTPGGSLRDALRAVLGTAAAAELLDLDAPGPVRVGGAVSQPRAHRAARDGLVIVVNGRRVHNRALVVAVEDAYRGLVPSGRHPYGAVVVELDPEAVDVNVHPAKREVRFREEGRVFAAVQRACWAALQGSRVYAVGLEWAPVEAAAGEGTPEWPVRGEPAGREAPSDVPRGTEAWAALGVLPASAGVPDTVGVRVDVPMGVRAVGEDTAGGGVAGLGQLRALGQAGSRWLLAESPRGVVLVDPHAAHEKVLYAELLASWTGPGEEKGGVRSQLLLIPAVVECDPGRLARLEAHAGFLGACGFQVEPFGPGIARCLAVPAACAGADAARLVGDLLDSLGDGEGGPLAPERRHRAAALMACHSAVRLGDALSPDEQQRLLDRLTGTPGGTTCPHGRPTVLLLDDATLRRAFRRPA